MTQVIKKNYGIHCPACNQTNSTNVIDSRPNTMGVRRRHLCSCGIRFTTQEILVESYERMQRIYALVGEAVKAVAEEVKE